MNGKNKFNIVFVLAIMIFTGISSAPAHAQNMGQYYHKGNAYSSYYDSGNQAINGWSTVVMATSSRMASQGSLGYTSIQAWARLDTLKAQYSPYYAPAVAAIETKMKTTTTNSDRDFYLVQTNPGHNVKKHSVDTFIFDLIDYKIPGVSLAGKLVENYANGFTSGTEQNLSNPKNGTLTFLNPTNASLSNNISWKDANKVIGSKNNSGAAAEFHFTVADGNQINVAPQARVQYGLYTANTIVPIKLWSNYAYVNHTLN
ncbi:hypothetical protein V4V36_27720 [Paenibacillus lautus]|jgi:hypothetical protein|uniref:Uncharacterized protein n=1 Tax=Paenibacillus lautus TaxID=1401 RepID=A0A385TLE0_PAELA|nr:hypothetical protein [Paenibacillus lautus]AYB44473.1 hypothetical protein D5F53_14865 [Paenibacillus lautus]MBY0162091.1 hypothetical protein [Cytobacillus firmus]VTR37844.1 Uncharacterised protein [Actinobacillus pleuropneumoniae]